VALKRTEDEVLRIQRDDVDAQRAVLILQGRIVAEWAGLLERECVELSRSGRYVVLDFSDVVFIGRSGLAVLGRLGPARVGIIGCSPLIAAILKQEGIDVGPNVGDENDGNVHGKRGSLPDT
jgi:anti-anti-sigma regulatory factor